MLTKSAHLCQMLHKGGVLSIMLATMNTVVCPHCKKQIELSEAIIHEFQTKIREEEKKSLALAFEKEKAEEKATHEKKLREEFEAVNKEREKELEETKKKEKELLEKIAQEKEE